MPGVGPGTCNPVVVFGTIRGRSVPGYWRGRPTGADRAASMSPWPWAYRRAAGIRKASCQAFGNGLCFHRAFSLPEER